MPVDADQKKPVLPTVGDVLPPTTSPAVLMSRAQLSLPPNVGSSRGEPPTAYQITAR